MAQEFDLPQPSTTGGVLSIAPEQGGNGVEEARRNLLPSVATKSFILAHDETVGSMCSKKHRVLTGRCITGSASTLGIGFAHDVPTRSTLPTEASRWDAVIH
jgi:hypothetical protein